MHWVLQWTTYFGGIVAKQVTIENVIVCKKCVAYDGDDAKNNDKMSIHCCCLQTKTVGRVTVKGSVSALGMVSFFSVL